MDDTAILNTLQALVEEHARHTGMGLDIVVGGTCFTIPPPPKFHVPSSQAAIQSGPAPDLRLLLTLALEPHVLRLATAKLLNRPTKAKF